MKASAETFNECVFLENLYICIYIHIHMYILLNGRRWQQQLFQEIGINLVVMRFLFFQY